MHAGASVEVDWRRGNVGRPGFPMYLVVATPADTRFKGRGFMALAAGARAPHGIAYAHARSRLFIPLYRSTDTAASGKIGIAAYRAGLQQLDWAVVAAGACGEHTLASGARKVDVVPGAANLVFQNRFSTASPKKRIRSPAGDYDLLIYDNHYDVIDDKTGALVLSEPGTDPNFSPTGRFVAARQPNSFFEIFDLVSGTKIAQDLGDEVLAWMRNDSYVLASGMQWGYAVVRNVVVDSGDIVSASPGPHCCGAWSSSQVIFDLDRGFAVIKGYELLTVQDLANSRKFVAQNDISLGPAQSFTAAGVSYIRRAYDRSYKKLSSIWSLGEPLRLSNTVPRDPDKAVQARFLAKPQEVPLAQQASLQGAGGGPLIGRTVEPKIKISDNSVFAALTEAGIKTSRSYSVRDGIRGQEGGAVREAGRVACRPVQAGAGDPPDVSQGEVGMRGGCRARGFRSAMDFPGHSLGRQEPQDLARARRVLRRQWRVRRRGAADAD